ncbi:MAG: serine/threonine protein kinase, partial [Planctomycetes bacterium]|nr:serine/threonine protein kinase [Planctomycetota bacterium]
MTFAQPFQDYEILDRVGAGAMGTVFKARHKKLGRIVALKVLKPSLARDSRYVDRLRREARIVASLNHPHIVTGYDLGEEGGYHFFVMEFVEGKSLRALLAEWGMFAEEYVLEVAIQIAQALDYAYQNKVIHRDIKPGNVLIDERGKVKLTDMGLAKGPTDLTLTRDGATVGTPQYISPEQARNPQDVDVRSDLYSLGATLYHMATGVPPFTGDTMADLLTKVLHDPPMPPNEVNPALGEGFSLVIRKLLAKDLRVRYQTPRELLDDLERLEQALPPQVDEARLAAGESERRVTLPTWGLVGLLAVAALGGAVWFGMQLRGEGGSVATSDPFLAGVDARLAQAATPGERWLQLQAVAKAAPRGTEVELIRRENVAFQALQAGVDRAAAAFAGTGFEQVQRWLREPREWPDRDAFEQRLMAKVAEVTGLLPRQLPSTINNARLDAVRTAVDRELAERDTELLRRLEEYLETNLPDRVTERLRADDFSGARKLWREALAGFCDGVREPAVERLAESTVRQARDRCDQHAQMARLVIDAAEAEVADAMRGEVETVMHHFDERLAAGADPSAIAEQLRTFRADLLQVWPASPRFRPDRDPWREIEREMGVVQQRTVLAAAADAARRFERRCDLAWRAFCHGETTDALAILADVEPPTDKLRGELAEHRRALQAAAKVEERLLGALAQGNRVVRAFPRIGSGLAVELRVSSESGRPALFAQAVGEVARHAVLTEFRFGELLRAVQKLEPQPFAGLTPAEAARGEAVFRLVGDDLGGFGALLARLDDPFLVDDIAPRIQRVRDEQAEVALDRTGLLQRMLSELAAARLDGQVHDLERAVMSLESQVPADDRTDSERRELRRAKDWLLLARHREDVYDDIARDAPN